MAMFFTFAVEVSFSYREEQPWRDKELNSLLLRFMVIFPSCNLLKLKDRLLIANIELILDVDVLTFKKQVLVMIIMNLALNKKKHKSLLSLIV